MIIKNKNIYSSFICIFWFSRIITSQEPITSEKIVIPKIDSWVSIISDASWEDTKHDFQVFKSIIEQLKYLADNNSFFNDDSSSECSDSDTEDKIISNNNDKIKNSSAQVDTPKIK